MKLLNINCNNCGNLLEVNHLVNYVTCNNCNSLLEIVKNETSYYTIDKVGSGSGKEHDKNQNNSQIFAEIEMLDREWNNNIPNYMVDGTLPDTDGTLISYSGIVVIIFIIIWTILTGIFFPPLSIFGIFGIIFAIWQLVNHNNRRTKFLAAKHEYETKRNELQRKIKV